MDYYVYKHIRLKDGSTFYVGKGRGNRIYAVNGRNDYWKRIVEKDGGFTTLLVKENISEEEAFELEKSIISQIGIENLTNMTEGGSGGDTRKGFTQDEYDMWIKHKSEAQTGKVGYWRDKKRDNHSVVLKRKHVDGVYDYNHLSAPKTEEHKQSLSKAALNRVRKKVVCDRCGIEIVDTHLKRHQISNKCITI
jgi:hypothetical protein